MLFEYSEVKTCLESIDVDDIGNCCLMSRDELLQERYLVIRTILGETQVIQYGPIVPDFDLLPFSLSYFYNRFDFNEGKIIKLIAKFCKEANHVELVDFDFIRDNLRNPIDSIPEFEESDNNTDGDEDEEEE